MSDQVTELHEDEILVDADVDTFEDNLEEAKKNVKEFKADDGQSEVPDAATSKTDEKPKGKGDAMPKTKIGMINAMVDAMKGKKKTELEASYQKMLKAMYEANDMDDEDEDDDDEEEMVAAGKKAKKESKKITKEDIDVSDDVRALFGDEDLSEEFKDKATTIFEAAVLSKVNEILESADIDIASDIEVEKEEMMEELTTKLDDYLEYVAEEWMKENELAVERGIAAEITENFMVGLRNLFAENYIDIPEEKVDLVDELAAKVEELEDSVNEEIERNIAIKKELIEMKSEMIMIAVCEDLTDSQLEKMKSLAEGVEFEDETSYAKRLTTIKENYFPKEEVSENDATDEEPLEFQEGTEVTGSMAAYTQAISRSIKK